MTHIATIDVCYEVRNPHSCGYSLGKESFEGVIPLAKFHQLLGEMATCEWFKRHNIDRYSAGSDNRYTDYPIYHLEIIECMGDITP